MSTGSQRLYEGRKMKGLKVIELFDQGYSYRKIASMAKVSLRDVAKFVNLAADKTRIPSTASINDLIVLEYRVKLLRSEVRDLTIERENLRNKVNDLRAQKYDLQIQVRAKQSEINRIINDKLETIIYDKQLIFLTSFLALTEALRSNPNIKSILFDLIMSQDVMIDLPYQTRGKAVLKNLGNDQFLIRYYNTLMPLYDKYLNEIIEIIHNFISNPSPYVRT